MQTIHIKSLNRNNSDHIFDILEDYRTFNHYKPKIKICSSINKKTTFSSNSEQLILTTSSEIKPALNNNFNNNDFKFKKNNQTNKFKQDFTFFETKRIEFLWTDMENPNAQSKKKKENKLYQAFKKLYPDNSEEQYNVAENSIFLKHYVNLIRLDENSGNVFEQRLKENDLIFEAKDDEDNKIEDRSETKAKMKENNATSEQQKNEHLKAFKSFFESESCKYVRKPSIEKRTIENENSAETNENAKLKLQETSSKIEADNRAKFEISKFTFNIEMNTLIQKKIRGTKEFHQRMISIKGPIVTWYRFKENMTSNTVKGFFDLRFSELKIIEPKKSEDRNFITDNEKSDKFDEFTVTYKNLDKSNNEITQELNFKSEKAQGNSIKTIFEQIKKYYKMINSMFNKNKLDYNILKYITDPNIESFFLSKDELNNELMRWVVDNLEWHYKLKSLHLKGIDKTTLNNILKSLSVSAINLEVLTLESSNNTVIDFDGENSNIIISSRNLFARKMGPVIREFHLIDVNVRNIKNILDLLRCRFNISPGITFKDQNKKMSEFNEERLHIRNLPYTKLSFRRNIGSSVASSVIIDLSELHKFFLDILMNCPEPEDTFDCLDISGSHVYNVEGLTRIIEDFKFLKTLNISGTRIIPPNKMQILDKYYYNNPTDFNSPATNVNMFLINDPKFLEPLVKPESEENGNERNENQIINSPILSTIIAVDTPLSQDVFTPNLLLLNIFKNFKFFSEIKLSDADNSQLSDEIKIKKIAQITRSFDLEFSENFMEIEYT